MSQKRITYIQIYFVVCQIWPRRKSFSHIRVLCGSFNGLIYRCFTLLVLAGTHGSRKYRVSSTLGRLAAHRWHQFCWPTYISEFAILVMFDLWGIRSPRSCRGKWVSQGGNSTSFDATSLALSIFHNRWQSAVNQSQSCTNCYEFGAKRIFHRYIVWGGCS
jgi:hypothetical protein